MNNIIDPAQEAEAEQIAEVVNRAYRPSPQEAGWTHESGLVSGERTSVDQVRRLFREGSNVLVMRHEGHVVACVHVERADGVCWIGMLATLPTLQAGGIGKKMLSAAEAFANKTYAPTALKMSVLTSRPELLSFYQRRGYSLTGIVYSYPAEAGVGTPQRSDLQVLELQKVVG